MTKEIWKDIPGFEGKYQISNLGNINSFLRKKGLLKLSIGSRGYTICSLQNKFNKSVTYNVHRLVALTFLGFNELTINHKDGDKTNNKLENLEYVTYSENLKHSFNELNRKPSKPMLGRIGYSNPLRKTVYQYTKEGEFIKEWASGSYIERILGFKQGKISACCLGKQKTGYGFIWKYI